MRVVSPYVQSLISATSDASRMSSRFPYRGRYSCRRGFSDRSRDGEEVFVSGDSHYKNVRDTNYGFRAGQRGGYSDSRGYPFQSRSWGPQRPPFRPPPRPDDFRSWAFSPSQAPPHWERFVVLSYNILADYLARDHRHRLYFHIPPYILDWEWRKRRIMVELGLWAPDIMCFQEVDKFEDLEIDLNPQGYSGIWKRNAVRERNGERERERERERSDRVPESSNLIEFKVAKLRVPSALAALSYQLLSSSPPSSESYSSALISGHHLPDSNFVKMGGAHDSTPSQPP